MTPMFAMTIDPWILAFSGITVIATVFMGFWSARRSKTAGDFFVAGRSVSVGWNASAISGEYLSAASFMGIAGMVMSSGYDALWYPVCYACGYLFLLLFIAGPLRRFGAYTIPDFAEGRYDSPVFRKIAVCFVLFIGFFYTMPQMKGAGTTLAYIFQDVDLRGGWFEFLAPHNAVGEAIKGFPYWAGVLIVGAVITLNVALGGMKGITLVQAVQYWVKMFAVSVPIFVLMAVYGHYGKQLSLNASRPAIQRPAGITWIETQLKANQSGSAGPTGKPLSSYVLPGLGSPKLANVILHPRPVEPRSIEAYLQQATDVTGTHYVVPKEVAAGSVLFGHSANLTNAQIAAAVEAALQNNQPEWRDAEGPRKENLVLIRESDRLAYVVPSHLAIGMTNVLSARSLPEKAPKDETWLSPFGPLTTKAAKAAATPRTVSDFELISGAEGIASKVAVLGQMIYAPNVLGQIERLKASFKKPAPQSWRTMIPATSSNVMVHMPAPLLAYAAAIGKPVLWQTNMAIQPFVMDVAHTAQTTDAEMAVRIESALRSNGVAFVMAPHDAVIAVNATELAKLRAESGTKPAAIPQTSVRPYALLYTYSLIIALVCGTAGLPHILVRFYTNPDGGAAKRTTMWVMILIGIFYVFPPVFGVMGRNLFPELYNGIGAKGTDKIVLELPRLLNEKYAPLGSILSGITCAGAFAAFMSTFSGLLVSMTGALAHDVYGRMLRPKSTPEQRMRMFKFAAVLIGGVSILLGSFVEPLEINFMVGQAFAIAAASYFPLLFMSVWWRGMTMRGAAVGMLTGGLCALVAATLTNVSNLALDKGPMGKIFAGFAGMNDFWAQHPLLRILCEQPAIWTVPLAITLMIVVSKATRKDVPSDVRMKMLVLHAPEKLGLKQEYIQEHQAGGH